MRVEIWSDVACPWCYVGKRRFERALGTFAERETVQVTWRSFQLDPGRPRGRRESLEATLGAKYGAPPDQVRAMNERVSGIAAAEGLEYRLDRYQVVNTFDAHRLIHLAARSGRGTDAHERLLRAQLIEGEDLEEPATLVRLGGEVGLEPGAVTAMLASDDCAAEVRRDLDEAAALGISGVPFFVLDQIGRAHV